MSADPAVGAQDNFSEAIGRMERHKASIDADRVEALANTLGIDDVPRDGSPLPPAWHWIFFNPFVRRRELGIDGHPKRGGFIPDVGLPRRMWAGGRLRYHAPVPIGRVAERVSEIKGVTVKNGRAGRLVFVTVLHRLFNADTLCIEEEQDIVYREAPLPGAPAPAPLAAPENAMWSETMEPDPVLLFRYSALTSNGHRIHYDSDYAREEEGYPALVVHGPLISTLLQGLGTRVRPQRRLEKFDFRAVSPLFVNQPFHVEAAPGEGDGPMRLWAKGEGNCLAMTAEAEFSE